MIALKCAISFRLIRDRSYRFTNLLLDSYKLRAFGASRRFACISGLNKMISEQIEQNGGMRQQSSLAPAMLFLEDAVLRFEGSTMALHYSATTLRILKDFPSRLNCSAAMLARRCRTALFLEAFDILQRRDAAL